MKKFLSVILCLALLPSVVALLPVSVGAESYSGTCGDRLSWSFNDTSKTLTITGTGNMADYTSAGAPWYQYRSDIRKINIGNGVTSIGEYAFENCVMLLDIVVPEGVTSIGNRAFSGCTALAEITIPDSITSIGDDVFSGCDFLEFNAYDNALYLGNETNPYYILYSAASKDIASCAVNRKTKIILHDAFKGCYLMRSVTIPESVRSIGGRAFSGCTALAEVSIPYGVTSIEDYTFYYCTSLTKVTIPDSVTSIRQGAFSACALKSIVIPGSVTEIGYAAFNSPSLTQIMYCGSEEEWNAILIDGGNFEYPGAVKRFNYDPLQLSAVGVCGDDLTWQLDIETGSLVIYGSGNMYNYSYGNTPWYSFIPSIRSVEIGNSVKSIGDWAFGDCNNMTSVTIPRSVTSIGNDAFCRCSSLTSIEIPDSVKSIGKSAFYSCTELISIDIPEGVKSIGDSAFYGCTSLESVSIPGSAKTTGFAAFNYCSSLKNVTISEGITAIGDYAFYGCSSLCKVTIPEGVTVIGNYAFEKCNLLLAVTIPKSVKQIGDAAFSNYADSGILQYVRDVYYPGTEEEWNEIDISSFNPHLIKATKHFNSVYDDSIPFVIAGEYGDDLIWIFDPQAQNVTISGTGKMYGFYQSPLYWYGSSIKTIVIEDGVGSIGGRAFENCTALKTIYIPESVESIGDQAFIGCNSLTDVYYSGTEEEWNSFAWGTFSDCIHYNYMPHQKTVTGVCGDDLAWELDKESGALTITGTGDMYDYNGNNVLPWAKYRSLIKTVEIENGVTSIGENAFCQCDSMAGISIPESVKSICFGAFYGCSSLASVVIPSGTTSINGQAFYNCSSLESISIPWSVTSISYYSFYGCSSLTSVTIADGVKSIGEYAFYGCSSLANIDIPDSLTAIGNSAFEDCASLSIIDIPAGVTKIWNRTFYGCSSLASITIPEGLKMIYDSAFYGCSSLTDIDIPDSVTYIGNSVFSGCSSLTKIDIPAGETSIGDEAFKGCVSLREIGIPESVKSIGNLALYRCSSLTGILIPESVTSIGNRAFYGCRSLTDAYYHGTKSKWNNIAINDWGNDPLIDAKKHFNYTPPQTTVSGSCGENLTWTLDLENGTFTVSGTGDMESYISPDSVPWHEYRSLIQSLKIADGVTSIGSWAFGLCVNLKSADIPDSVVPIEYLAFSGTALTDITIREGVTSIGEFAFSACLNLKSVTLPVSLTSIERCAFQFCIALSDVYYNGSARDWDKIVVEESNEPILEAEKHFTIVFEPGDVNGDGRVTMSDVLMVRKYLAGIIDLTNEQYFRANLVADEYITMSDLLRLRKIIAGID